MLSGMRREADQITDLHHSFEFEPQGVKIYDTTTEQRITFIDRPGSSPRADLFKCRLCWRSDTELLIGWAALVKIAVVKDRPKDQMKSGLPAQYVEITTM